jgi:hypothetical protein
VLLPFFTRSPFKEASRKASMQKLPLHVKSTAFYIAITMVQCKIGNIEKP